MNSSCNTTKCGISQGVWILYEGTVYTLYTVHTQTHTTLTLSHKTHTHHIHCMRTHTHNTHIYTNNTHTHRHTHTHTETTQTHKHTHTHTHFYTYYMLLLLYSSFYLYYYLSWVNNYIVLYSAHVTNKIWFNLIWARPLHFSTFTSLHYYGQSLTNRIKGRSLINAV